MWLSRRKEFQVRSHHRRPTHEDRALFLDVAAHYLAAAGISAVRRTKKSDNNRISRATGAIIVNDTGDLKEEDVGTGCGLFEIRKIGDEYVLMAVRIEIDFLRVFEDTTPSLMRARTPKRARSSYEVPTRMF